MSRAFDISSGGSGGTTRSTRSIALSTSMPVGSPLPSRCMKPPRSCQSPARSRSTSASARLLAQPACPSMRRNHTARSGKAASRSRRLGKTASGQSFWSQPRPSSQAPSGKPASNSRRRPRTSSLLSVPTRLARVKDWARPARWACESIRPGISVRPPMSTCLEEGKAANSASRSPIPASVPSAAMASAPSSSAPASGASVYIRAFSTRVTSALGVISITVLTAGSGSLHPDRNSSATNPQAA